MPFIKDQGAAQKMKNFCSIWDSLPQDIKLPTFFTPSMKPCVSEVRWTKRNISWGEDLRQKAQMFQVEYFE